MEATPILVEPGREWRRALVACLVGTGLVGAGFLLLADVEFSGGAMVATAAVALVLGVIATFAAAGGPPTLARRVAVHEDRIVLETDEGDRVIRPDEIVDLRAGRLLLSGGERLDLPPAVRVAVAPLVLRSVIGRIRTEGREYRHELEPPRPGVRVARWTVGLVVTGLVGLGIFLAARSGAVPLAVVATFGVGLLAKRAIDSRREDHARSGALDVVTLDEAGIRITDRGGGVTTIAWDEVEDVPPVPGRKPVVIETEDTTHLLPWSFHPSLARDLHLCWRSLDPGPAPSGQEGSGDAEM